MKPFFLKDNKTWKSQRSLMEVRQLKLIEVNQE